MILTDSCLLSLASPVPGLAGLYQTHLYNYLDKELLASEYRSQLTLRELQAYNADLHCLQEVSE